MVVHCKKFRSLDFAKNYFVAKLSSAAKYLQTCALIVIFVLPCVASRTVHDQLGRTVTVPDHPHRIICLMPSVTDAVFSLGAGNDVVAVSDYSNYPAEAKSKPSVGSLLNPSMETIVALHPDLAIGSSDFNRLKGVDQIEKFGIPVFMVRSGGIEGIYSSLLAIGDALNRNSEAQAEVKKLRDRVSAVEARVAHQPKIHVFILIWPEPITTIGKHAFITEMIAAAGGESITDDLSEDWPVISFESLVTMAPEHLLLVHDGRVFFNDLVKRPGWNILPAIKTHSVYYTDDRMYSPSPVAIDALEDLAKEFHPEADAPLHNKNQ
jgi:ABC-type Fe3+-hydroxamate transport system substrate-binding protein